MRRDSAGRVSRSPGCWLPMCDRLQTSCGRWKQRSDREPAPASLPGLVRPAGLPCKDCICWRASGRSGLCWSGRHAFVANASPAMLRRAVAFAARHAGCCACRDIQEPPACCGYGYGCPVVSSVVATLAVCLVCRQGRWKRAALERLAGWAAMFTPGVSIDGDRALLLEISGSLQLFGGPERIRTLLRQGLQVRGHEAVISCTPTVRASLWLARAGIECMLLTRRRTASPAVAGPC